MRIALQGKTTIAATGVDQRLVTDAQLIAAFGSIAATPLITGVLVRACKSAADGNTADAFVGTSKVTSGSPGMQHLVALDDRRGFIVPHHQADQLLVNGTINDVIGWVLYF